MSEPTVERVANLLMDMRMDGPWWKPPSTLTYQEAMRHYATEIVKELAPAVAELRTALIGNERCENFTGRDHRPAPVGACFLHGRRADAAYGADLACWPCRIDKVLAAA